MQVERPTTKLFKVSMFYVYVLQDPDGKFYLGYTKDLKQRLRQHNEGKNKSTKFSQWQLIYYEAYTSSKLARAREQKLKRNPRMRKLLMQRVREEG